MEGGSIEVEGGGGLKSEFTRGGGGQRVTVRITGSCDSIATQLCPS